MGKLIKNRSISNNVVWSAIERFSVQGIQFLLSIILARLVMPSDYGIIALVLVFLSIAQAFIDGGFSNALIHRQQRTEVDFSTVFFFNIIISIIAYLILFFLSPYLSIFYNEIRLSIVIRVVGLSLIIDSFSIVQRTRLIINHNFKTQSFISLIAIIISGSIGVFCAYHGMGVWALVIQSLINSLIITILLWIFLRWRPLICFSVLSFKRLFKHGSSLLLIAILNNIFMNLYYLVIGKFYSSAYVGYYSRAAMFAQYPSNNVSNTINRAIFPILCEAQNDTDKLYSLYSKILKLTIFILFPIMTVVCSLSKPFIIVVLGEKWIDCAGLLHILCIAYFLTPVINLITQMLYATHSIYSLKVESIKKIVSVLILLLTIPMGLNVMCWGLVIFSVFDYWIMSKYLNKVIKISFIDNIKLCLPTVSVCVLIYLVGYLMTFIFNSAVVQLIVGGVLSVFSYLLLVRRFDEYRFFKQYIISLMKRI